MIRQHWFETAHPAVLFCYLAGVLGLCLASLHPLYVAGSMACALCVNLWLRGPGPTLRTLRFALLLFCIVALANPLFNGRGATTLFFLFQTPFTLEALLYGVCSGGMLVSMWLWCAVWQQWMTGERFYYLFANFAPTLSLMGSMVCALLPQSARKLAQIRLCQRGGAGKKERVRGGVRQLSALLVMDMEDSMQTADAMRCKGFGSGKRTVFSLYRFGVQDGVLLGVSAALLALAVWGVALANAGLSFYPFLRGGAPSAALFGCLLAFCLLPLFVQGKEWLSCRRSV